MKPIPHSFELIIQESIQKVTEFISFPQKEGFSKRIGKYHITQLNCRQRSKSCMPDLICLFLNSCSKSPRCMSSL